MTMHMMGHAYSTINTRKSKMKKLTDSKIRELEPAWHAHNRALKRSHQPKISFSEYVEDLYGLKPLPTVKKRGPELNPLDGKRTNYRRDEDLPSFPSNGDGIGVAHAPEAKQYSGERKLMGIATMHKSNMVPVFEDDEGKQYAKDLARMRRN